MKRLDIDWRRTFQDWSNNDLDSLEREVQEEKIRRAAMKRKGFQSRNGRE